MGKRDAYHSQYNTINSKQYVIICIFAENLHIYKKKMINFLLPSQEVANSYYIIYSICKYVNRCVYTLIYNVLCKNVNIYGCQEEENRGCFQSRCD